MTTDQRAVFGGQVTERTSAEWYTPASIFDALGIDFDLDPASLGAEVVPWIRTDTRWAQAVLPLVDAVCFVAGRIGFVPGPGATALGNPADGGGAGSMLLAIGDESVRAVRECGLGWVP